MIYKVTTKLIYSTLLIAKSNAKKKRRTKRASQSTAFTNSRQLEESCSLEGKSTIQLNKIEYGIRGSPYNFFSINTYDSTSQFINHQQPETRIKLAPSRIIQFQTSKKIVIKIIYCSQSISNGIDYKFILIINIRILKRMYILNLIVEYDISSELHK